MDFISLPYFDESESKLVVDFIGSMLHNTLDVDAYIAQAVELSDVEELIYARKITNVILAEANLN